MISKEENVVICYMCLAIIGNEDVLFSQLNPIEMRKQQHVFSD